MRRKLTHGHDQITYPGWPAKDRRWIEELPEQLGARKFRLLLSAWCRDLMEPWLDKTLGRDKQLCEYVKGVYLAALEVNDRFADTGKSKTALKKARETTFFRSVSGTESVSSIFDTLLSEDSLVGTLDRCAQVAAFRDKVPNEELVPMLRRYLTDLTAPDGEAGQIEPGCRVAKVVSLAESIYQGRQFERMPELAPALEQAGCRNNAVLAHCRAAEPAHNRGCWVLDRVLAKE